MRDRPSDTYRRHTEQRLGRRLGTNEVVDHLNEDKSDQSPLNLHVEDRSVHTTKHNKTRELGRLRKALTMPQRGEKSY